MPAHFKSRVLCLATLVVALLFVRFYEDRSLSYLALYSLLLLFSFSGLSVLLAPFLVRVEETASKKTVVKAEPFRYVSTVKNRSIFPYAQICVSHFHPDLIRYDFEEESTFLSVGPRKMTRAEHWVTFPYRGIYPLGIRTVQVTDFLGLFQVSFQVPHKRSITVTVYPQSDEAFVLPLKKEPQNRSVVNYDFYTDPNTEIRDLRRYTPSDDVRKIHWKLSAKRYELMVKDYESAIQNQTLLFLDSRRIPLEEPLCAAFEDRMVCEVASAVQYCSRNRTVADLVYGEVSDRLHLDPAGDLEPVSRVLAGISFTSGSTLFPSFYRSIDPGAKFLDLVLFLSSLEPQTYESLKASAHQGRNVILFFFTSPDLPLSDETARLLEELQVWGATIRRVTVE